MAKFMVIKDSLKVTPKKSPYYEGEDVILVCECMISMQPSIPYAGPYSVDFVAYDKNGKLLGQSTDHKSAWGGVTEKASAEINIGKFSPGTLEGYVTVDGHVPGPA